MLGDSTFLHMRTINDNHAMNGSWDMEHDRQNVLTFWTIFCPFTPVTWKIKIWKIEKNAWRNYHFTNVYHKWQSSDVWLLRHGAWQTGFFAILDHFLPFYPPNKPKNQYEEKMEKTAADIIILHMCTKNYDHMMCSSWDIVHNGWTDGTTEKVTYRVGCPT